MPCTTNACRQGREPCPSPWACGLHTTHRAVIPIMDMPPPADEESKPEEDVSLLPAWALWAGVVAAVALLVWASLP